MPRNGAGAASDQRDDGANASEPHSSEGQLGNGSRATPPSRPGWRRSVPAAGALLGALLDQSPAFAQDYYLFDVVGGGLFVGYGFGEGGGAVTWGLEAFASRSEDPDICSSGERNAVGAMSRFTLQGLSRPLFSLGAHAGKELDRAVMGLNLEAGLALGFPEGLEGDAGFSPYTAVGVEPFFFNVFSQHYYLLDVYPVGLSFRPISIYGFPGYCVVGRPQRDDEGRVQRVSDEHLRAGVAARGPGLAHDFARAACEEYESVPAFVRVANELHHLGAPQRLQHTARRAVADELKHTAMCTALARRAGLFDFEPSVPAPVSRTLLAGSDGVERLAMESWLDGCLGEGLAAVLEADESRRTLDAEVAATRSRIARDEQEHAELAWGIVAWCCSRQPSVRKLLRAALDAPLTAPRRASGDPVRRQRLAEVHRVQCRQRLAALL